MLYFLTYLKWVDNTHSKRLLEKEGEEENEREGKVGEEKGGVVWEVKEGGSVWNKEWRGGEFKKGKFIV